MKKFLIILLAFFLLAWEIWEVFSQKKIFNTPEKDFYQEKSIILDKKNEKKEDKYKKIFYNVPNYYQDIIKNFLKKYENKKYFSHIEKISWWSTKNRWLASWTKIYFNFNKIDSKEEFKRVMIHEMGHIFDLWYLKSKEKKIKSNFRDWTKTIYADDPSVEFYSLCFENEYEQNWKCWELDFASKYWQIDPFEDFAESFLLYIENNQSFIEMTKESKIMKKKYDFLKKYFWKINTWKYFWQEEKIRVRDMTLAY